HLRGMLALGQITGAATAFGAGHLGANLAWGQGAARQNTSGAGDSTAPAAEGAAWEVPVSSCVATRDEGIGALLLDLRRHFAWLTTTAAGQARRAARSRLELSALLRERVSVALLESYADEIEALAERVSRGELDPWAASQVLLSRWKLGGEAT
ncbi:MAG TPA: hypothetical protein VJU61_26970, partial [Polyangiaceae bacterium]|nr:hypothetical protein [Polyangiaceae bacterium]